MSGDAFGDLHEALTVHAQTHARAVSPPTVQGTVKRSDPLTVELPDDTVINEDDDDVQVAPGLLDNRPDPDDIVHVHQDEHGDYLVSGAPKGLAKKAAVDAVDARLTVVEAAVGTTPVVFTAKRTTNSGTLTPATWTLIGIDEVFDSHGFYNGSKFQPTKGGFYHFTAQVFVGGVTAGSDTELAICKNGTVPTVATTEEGGDYDRSDSTGALRQAEATIFLNGSTDYVEVYLWCSAAGTSVIGNSQPKTTFSGFNVGQASVQYATTQAQVPTVTSLTAGVGPIPNPIPEGFEVYVDPGGVNTGMWRLKYVSALSKWKWVGGGMLRSTLPADAATTGGGGSYSGTLTDGVDLCKLVVPFAGDYWGESRVGAYVAGGITNLAGGIARSSATGGTADASPQVWQYAGSNGNSIANLEVDGLLTGAAAGQTLVQIYLYTAQIVNFVNRTFWVRPALVG